MKKVQSFGWIGMMVVAFLVGVVLTSVVMMGSQISIGDVNTAMSASSASSSPTRSARSLSSSTPTQQLAAPTSMAQVPVVAVNGATNLGVAGSVVVRLIDGTGQVLMNTNPFSEPDLQQSGQIAVAAAQAYSGVDISSKDVVINFEMPTEEKVIGGPSAGAAMSVAAIAALTHKSINPTVAITGTINQDGTIGQVGGIEEKAQAAAQNGYKTFLVPEGQSTVTEYQPRVTQINRYGMALYRTTYVQTTVNVADIAKKQWGLKVVEVADLAQATQYMLQ